MAAIEAMAVLALGLAGCSARAAPSGTKADSPRHGTLSARQATAILTETMATNNRANAASDLPLLRTYESGSALAIDGAQYTMSKLAKRFGTKPSAYQPFTIHPLQVVVGGGGTYPEGFLVLGDTYLEGAKAQGSCPHAGTLLQFEKASASSPWRIALEPAADEGRFVTLAATGDVAPTLSSAEIAAADGLPKRIATDLQYYEVSGKLGPFAPGDFTGACWAIPDPRKELQQTEAAGLSGRELYDAASGTVAYKITAGAHTSGSAAAAGVLVLFTLHFENELFASANSPIDWTVQPALDPISVLLPAGHYSSVYEHGYLELAAELESGGRVSIVGEYDGITSVTGTRAKAGGGGSGTLEGLRLP